MGRAAKIGKSPILHTVTGGRENENTERELKNGGYVLRYDNMEFKYANTKKHLSNIVKTTFLPVQIQSNVSRMAIN